MGLLAFSYKEVERRFFTFGERFFKLLFFGDKVVTKPLKQYKEGFDFGFSTKFVFEAEGFLITIFLPFSKDFYGFKIGLDGGWLKVFIF